MQRHISIVEARQLVTDRSVLEGAGWRSRDITDAVRSGRIIRLQRNQYVPAELLTELWPESRHLLGIAAADAERKGGSSVFSYQSAAVLWGLPLARHLPDAVHMSMLTDDRMSSRAGLRRHADRLHPSEVTERFGLPCTTLERTIWDLCRTVAPTTGIAAADAALRSTVRDAGGDRTAADVCRRAVLELGQQHHASRGARRAEAIVAFADDRADSSGESITRWLLAEIGFRRIGVQVRVPGPSGTDYRVDVELEDEAVFVEFDGAVKYQDDAMRGGRSIEDVLLAEKRREDWIRGVTQRRLVRVGWADIESADSLATRLRAFGVSPR